MKKQRNETLDWLKLFSAFLVVWLHIRFPGTLNTAVSAVASVAVPLFFATSGYFNVNAGSETIKRRLIHIVKLALGANALYLCWGIWSNCVLGGKLVTTYLASIFTPDTAIRLLLGTITPPCGSLWFLNALAICYIILWVYVRFWGDKEVKYGSLYLFAFLLSVGRVCMETFANISGISLHYSIHRNAFFFGLPMFALGMFLHEYKDRIFSNFNWNWKKSLALLAFGMFYSFLETFYVGSVDMTIGANFGVIALLLLAAQYPSLPGITRVLSPLTPWVSQISLVIYVTHPLINNVIRTYQNEVPLFAQMLKHTYRYPVFVLLIAAGVGVLCCCVTTLWKKMKSGKGIREKRI